MEILIVLVIVVAVVVGVAFVVQLIPGLEHLIGVVGWWSLMLIPAVLIAWNFVWGTALIVVGLRSLITRHKNY